MVISPSDQEASLYKDKRVRSYLFCFLFKMHMICLHDKFLKDET